MRTRRRSLSSDEVRTAAERVTERLIEATQDTQNIAVYDAIDGELSVQEFVDWAWQEGKWIYYPRVTGPLTMELCRVKGPYDLAPGKFGIREPTTPASNPLEVDCFLVPGIAFDANGGRIGFGGGYYDSLLGALQADESLPKIVGVAYEWQIIEQSIPTEPHDVRVHYVATESRLLDCTGVNV